MIPGYESGVIGVGVGSGISADVVKRVVRAEELADASIETGISRNIANDKSAATVG